MALIKVTGYLESEDLKDSYVDLSHEMGVSAEGYERLPMELGLQDVEFELQAEDA